MRPGDVINYWLKDPLSYPMGVVQTANQDNSACNNLSAVSYGINTCTGYKGDLICRTTGCGCIKGRASKDCGACNSLCNVSVGVDTCTGIKR